MKTTSLVTGLFLASSLSAFSTPVNSILLTGETAHRDSSATMVMGKASAIVRSTAPGGDLRISADEISCDATSGILKCTGNVIARVNGRTITARELTIELSEIRGGNVYVLNPNGITIGTEPASKAGNFEAWVAKKDSHSLPSFDARPGTLLPRR